MQQHGQGSPSALGAPAQPTHAGTAHDEAAQAAAEMQAAQAEQIQTLQVQVASLEEQQAALQVRCVRCITRALSRGPGQRSLEQALAYFAEPFDRAVLC